MANSSFYKNVGTSTQLQGSASASAAAALASEQAALASKNAAAVSETNSAASAASAQVYSNAAATSASSINANAISTAADVITTAGHAATTTADAATTTADAASTAADVVLTNADVVSTNADAVATAADRVQTGLDVTASSASAAAALVSKNAAATSETNAAASATSSSADATATAADRVQTGLDRTATNADATQTAADRVQTGLDATASASSASAASTSASAASASQVAAASSAAAAANSYDQFDDRYLGSFSSNPSVDNDGDALVVGALAFINTANEMRVFDGSSWIAASSAGGASLINYHYTATASQTTFSGSDENSNTLSYTVENLIVTRNGIVLEDGTDYTATNGTSVVLAVAAAVGDEINIVAFKSFTTADMVSKSNGGAFVGNVDFGAGIDVTGNITATGTVDGRDVATDGTKLDGIEASADVTDATNVAAAGAAMLTGANFTGNVDVTGTVTASGDIIRNDTTTGTSKFALQYSGADAAVFKRNNATGVATIANGYAGSPVDAINISLAGAVGIGTASPANTLHVEESTTGTAVRIAKGGNYIHIGGSGSGTQYVKGFEGTVAFGNVYAGNTTFVTNDITRMTINSDGEVLIGSAQISSATRFTVDNGSSGRAADIYRASTSSTAHITNFYSDVGGTKTIQQVMEASGDIESRTSSLTGTSDRTLKENITDATNQWADIKALEFKNYNFIGDPDRPQLGVIAQDVESAGMTGLVKTSEETGKMSVKYTVMFMKAVIALQEAMDRIETLEAQVAALENA